jgi:hypothetical protein
MTTNELLGATARERWNALVHARRSSRCRPCCDEDHAEVTRPAGCDRVVVQRPEVAQVVRDERPLLAARQLENLAV